MSCQVTKQVFLRAITSKLLRDVCYKTLIEQCAMQSGFQGINFVTSLSRHTVCLMCQRRLIHSTALICSAKSKNSKKKLVKPVRVNTKALRIPVVTIVPNMTVSELAEAMGKDTDHVFEALVYVHGGDKYDHEESVIDNMQISQEIVKKSGLKFMTGRKDKQKGKEKEVKDVVQQPPPDPALLVPRPPVVTIMGHVDHGKTTLLDALRKSNIVEQEFGGITQHIGAFSVKLQSGEAITFLDTPGHAAFSAMRARGARVTDIIVLVVAADDGVMNQTIESIQHAKSANVPIIVAINKIDKLEADIGRTKQMLLEHQLYLEDFGGDIQTVPISALKGTNLQELQEAIVTQAELMELKADTKGLVEGRVVEACTDPGRGKLATAVIQRGTLRRGICLVAGTSWAKVRGMFSDKGQPLQEAPPSTPVEIIGWKEIPSAGDEILQVESEHMVKEIIQYRREQEKLTKLKDDQIAIEEKRAEHDIVYKEALQKRREAGYKKRLRERKPKESVPQNDDPRFSLILKGDVDGSVEAILDTLDTFHSKKCRLDLVHYGIGNITESDVELAEAFEAEIFGFNVQAPDSVSRSAKSKQVALRLHKVIYKLFDSLQESLSARLPLLKEEEILGEAQVLQVFQVSDGKKKIPVAGCRCTRGMLQRKKSFKVLRGEEIIFDGPLLSLKHFKNEVDSVKTDVECGISVADMAVQFMSGDVIQCYDVKEIDQEIDWQPGF